MNVAKKSPGVRGSSLARRIALLAGLALAPFALAIFVFAGYVYGGVVAGGRLPTGSLGGFAVRAPVTILRDARGIPHIRAHNEHDLFFSEGYAQASDRLFQLDVYRRLVAGRLSEIFGSAALASDENARVLDIDAIARAQIAALTPAERANLQAFADGVNAAIRTRPLPPEFRFLAYTPEPWTPKDSIVSSFSTVLALTDDWYAVAARIGVIDEVGPAAKDAFFSISDPLYDAPATSRERAPVAPLPPLTVRFPKAPSLFVASSDALRDERAGLGSNNFVSGGAFTATHRALLANDPHLELRIPGVWWVADLEAPGLHVAGVTLAGVPGIVLGHNAHLAWGATNGTVATVEVYRETFRDATSDEYRAGTAWVRAERRIETFAVRFAKPVTRTYLRTRHGFVFEDLGVRKLAAAWVSDIDRRSSFAQFDALDRAASASAGLAALAAYSSPAQNFVLADDAGNAGYVLAGEIPTDPAWGMVVHDGTTSPPAARAYVPYAALPHLAAGKSVVAFTANARPYGKGYPYRLSASFAPPYRAANIGRHLARRPYDIASFSAIQADIVSLPEADLAAAAARAIERRSLTHDAGLSDAYAGLRAFKGTFSGNSRGAVFVTVLRRAATERLVRYHMSPAVAIPYLQNDEGAAFVAVMRALRDRPRGWVPSDDYDAFLIAALRDAVAALHKYGQYDQTWEAFGARTALHPLAAFGLSMWNGVRFPGNGDPYSPHVQAPANAQSFRAVWDIGNWNAGGIVIPQGESGEPGSAHYRDAAAQWLAGGLVPLPFDDRDVIRAASETLVLKRF